jgi:hypothetical protein
VLVLALLAKPTWPDEGEAAVNEAVTTKLVVEVDPHIAAKDVSVNVAEPDDTETGEPAFTPSTLNCTVPVAPDGETVAVATKGPVMAPNATV